MLFSNAGAFVLMTMLIDVPLILLRVYEAGAPIPSSPDKIRPLSLVTAMGAIIGPAIASGAVTYGVLQQLAGRQTGFRESFRFGFSRVFPVIVVTLASILISMLGFCACIVPGLVILSVLFVAVPAAVVEGGTFVEALRRSEELTRGARWSIFAIVAALMLLNLAVSAGLVLTSFDPVTRTVVPSQSRVLLFSLVAVPLQALQAITTAVAYHDLRVEREGARTSDLASAFD